MEESSSFKTWLLKLFGLVLIFVASVAAVVGLAQFDLMRPYQSIMLGAVLFASMTFLWRQHALLRDVKMLKEHSWDLNEYEKDIDRRVNSVEAAKPIASSEYEEKIDALAKRLSSLERRVADLSLAPAPAQAADGKKSAMPDASMTPFNIALGLPDEPRVARPSSNTSTHIAPSPASAVKKTPVSKAVKTAIKDNKLDLHLQPIVELPTRKPAFFEAFMRLQIEDQRYMEAKEFLQMAEQGGLMPAIDSKVIFASVRMLRTLDALKKKAGLFCNISNKTLTDTRSFNKISAFLEANSALSKFLVLEIGQRNYVGLKAKERARLSQLVDLGYALSLDGIADLNLDAEALSKVGFQYAKVPATILLHANVDDERLGIHPTRLSAVLEDRDIRLIATEIEQENQAISLIDFDVAFGQGAWFAPPRPVKRELLDRGNAENISAPLSRRVSAV